MNNTLSLFLNSTKVDAWVKSFESNKHVKIFKVLNIRNKKSNKITQ